jgi:hypothetical protein
MYNLDIMLRFSKYSIHLKTLSQSNLFKSCSLLTKALKLIYVGYMGEPHLDLENRVRDVPSPRYVSCVFLHLPVNLCYI